MTPRKHPKPFIFVIMQSFKKGEGGAKVRGNEKPEMAPASRLWECLVLAVPLPALAVGVLVMKKAAVPQVYWLQNLIVGIAMFLISPGLACARWERWTSIASRLVIAVAIVALAATLFSPGLEGVHRWLRWEGIRLNVGQICLPLLLIEFKRRSELVRAILSLAVLALLVAQPDAAAVVAFGAATLFLATVTGKDVRRFWFALIVVAFIVAAVRRPDPLGRVSYVEDIVALASHLGMLWTVAALVSLALLPLPFLLLWKTVEGPLGFALALYYVVTLLAPCFGNFPVPLLGYGASSYIGYFTAVAWVSGRLKGSIPALDEY